MIPSTSADVLVIGAGPVGLTLACELKRRGVSVRLVERREKPLFHPNAAVVHVRTLEILSAMGAVEGFLREGYALPGLHSRAFGKRIGYIRADGVDSPFPAPRTLGQQITERLLTEHFEKLGGRIERQVEAIRIEQDAKSVRVRLLHLGENNREENAVVAWVVGCEGSKSITRENAGIPSEGERYAGKEFLQVDARVRWSHPHGYAYQFIEREHAVFCFPYNGQGFYRIICARTDQNPENHEPPTLEEMQAILRGVAGPATELYDPTWFNRFRSGYRLAARLREGRAFLAGDAAHVHVPIGGQGMNYGMHDAFNLGWKLAAVVRGEAKPELLDTYMTERHPVDAALVRGTDRSFHLLIEHAALAGTVLRFVGSALFSIPALQERIRNTLGEINVAYPASPLSEDYGGSGGPAAGERAPDALVVRMPEKETLSLFDVFRGTGWTLLLFGGPGPSADEIGELRRVGDAVRSSHGGQVACHLIACVEPPAQLPEEGPASFLMDSEVYAHAKYGVAAAPCLYLIRPDGYVAFRGTVEHRSRLMNYLERILNPAPVSNTT